MTRSTDQPVSQTNQRPGCLGWFVRDGRLRSGWRVLLYLIATLLVQFAIAFAIGIALAVVMFTQGISPQELGQRIAPLVSGISGLSPLGLGFRFVYTLIVVGIVWLFRHFLDKRSFRSLGFQFARGWWLEALAGFAFAILMWGVIFLLSLTFGAATVVSFEWERTNGLAILGGLLLGLLFNICVGIAEETDARGYILQNLAEGIRFFPAVLLSSLYFGMLHLLNPGAGLASTLGILFAGLLLAMGYYATGRLWFPIALHAGWNFAEGPLFGFLVSGLKMGGLFDLRVSGPDWLMGGAFGPEAGALAIVVEIVAAALLFAFGWRRNHAGWMGEQATRPQPET